jgi:LCP family protein required for cell wall assembly
MEYTNNYQLKKKKKWLIPLLIIVAIVVFILGFFAWKTGYILNKISTKGGVIQSLIHTIPGIDNSIKGEKEGRINILLLAMRGANDPAGGTLADTIEVFSIEPKSNKTSLISLPRDLFVNNPAVGYKTKINAVYAYGEQKSAGQGIAYMEQAVGEVAGIPIHYAVSINYDAFTKLIDAMGGVKITLSEPFEESVQFNQAQPCDSYFTVPTGKYENKTKRYFSKTAQMYKTRVTKSYPLCTVSPEKLECGGDFKLPAGTQTLNSTQALCYARSRETSNDFERAKRQQQIISAIKDTLLSAGTLTDFGKLNNILDSLGDNVKTDMKAWEIKRLYDLYSQMTGYTLQQKVVDSSNDSEVGLVYGMQDPTFGDILVPKGDNFDRFHQLFQNIFAK